MIFYELHTVVIKSYMKLLNDSSNSINRAIQKKKKDLTFQNISPSKP